MTFSPDLDTVSVLAAVSATAVAHTRLINDRMVMYVELFTTADKTDLTPLDALVVETGVRDAVEKRLPLVLRLETTGPGVEFGLAGLAGWGRIAKQMVRASGVIPQVCIASGPVLSGPSLLLGLADITIFTADAYAFVSGPQMVESFTGVPISAEDLGGVSSQSRSSGVAALVASDLDDAIELAGDVLAFLPNHVDECPPNVDTDDPVDRLTPEAGEIVPSHATGSYDVRDVIRAVADDDEFFELRGSWAPNMVTGFASFGGHTVGVVANQSQSLAGSIDIPASQKGARFVGMCDSFNIPLLTMVDTSGFLPGKDLEWRGMIRHGAQLAFSYARATVPRVGLILRKSYGGAYIVMDSRYMGNDIMFAWPSAEVAVMGAKGAVEILHRKADAAARVELEAAYERDFLSPYPAAERGSITSVIEPSDTRANLVAAFDLLATKRERLRARHHDNLPL
ncbi:MAG: carboxyl transferase domain-containing protein [Acidimicrobiales bacterium]